MSDGAPTDTDFMRMAIALSSEALEDDAGGPFGAIITRDAQVVGSGRSRVFADIDPTAHAEMIAIRTAARTLGTHELENTTLFTVCEPCPMCLAAAHRARIHRIVFANIRSDAVAIGFDNDFRDLVIPLVERTIHMEQLLREEAQEVFVKWASRTVVA